MNRMKIFGILAVLLALLAFTGCDEILEAFYPEFGEGGTNSGTYGIGIWAEIVIPAGEPIPDGQPMIGAKAVDAWSGDPEPLAEAYVAANWDYTPEGDTIFSAYIELYLGDEGDYRVIVWGESDNNRQPDWDEPATDAVWYHADASITEGGFWDNIFSFWADDTEYGPWRDGEALIWTEGGEGGAPNYHFRVNGQMVINRHDTGSKAFDIKTDDANKQISDFSWDLYDASYGWLMGQWVPLTTASSEASFTISETDITQTSVGGPYAQGWYWLEVNMTFSDGTYRYKRYQIRVIDEVTTGTSFDVVVNISDADWDPMYLSAGSAYDVQIKVFNKAAGPDSVTPVALSATVDNATNYGRLQVSTAAAGLGLSYNATDYTDLGSPVGIDVIEIVVDSTNDGAFGPGDFKRRFGLSLDYADDDHDPGNYLLTIETSGWDFQPILQ